MEKKIVQFIRTTENLENVIKTPVDLGKKLDLPVELFLVLESQYFFAYPVSQTIGPAMDQSSYMNILGSMEKESKKALQELIDTILKELKHPIAYDVQTGQTGSLLEEKSKEKGTEFIVINESTKEENVFMIKSFQNLSDISGCPVLKIPNNYKSKPFEKILYATDYKEEDIPTLKRLLTIARVFDAEITALHITDSVDLEEKMKSTGFEKMVQEKVGYSKINFKIHPSENIGEGITQYAKDTRTDLIVALKQNKGFFQKLFQGSSSEKILSHAELPVLIFNQDK